MKEDNPNDWLVYLGLVTQLGLVVVFTILAGCVIGVFIDKKFHTSPVFVIVFIVIGVTSGLFNADQLIMRKMK